MRWRNLLILALCGFVTSFGAHIVATNLPWYAESIGAGAFIIGLLIAIYDFAELFAKAPAGFIADRRGMKRTLLVGLVIFIFGSLLFLVIPAKLLLLVRFAQGLGAARFRLFRLHSSQNILRKPVAERSAFTMRSKARVT